MTVTKLRFYVLITLLLIIHYYSQHVYAAPIQSSNKNYSCTKCTKHFTLISGLNRHIKEQHQTSKAKSFICAICLKGFHRRSHLDSHKVIHSDARPFRCDSCQYSCKRKDILQSHIRKQHKTFYNKSLESYQSLSPQSILKMSEGASQEHTAPVKTINNMTLLKKSSTNKYSSSASIVIQDKPSIDLFDLMNLLAESDL